MCVLFVFLLVCVVLVCVYVHVCYCNSFSSTDWVPNLDTLNSEILCTFNQHLCVCRECECVGLHVYVSMYVRVSVCVCVYI